MAFEIKFPKIFKTIQFSDYAPEMGDQKIDVWVNVPSSVLKARDEMIEAGDELQKSIEELAAKAEKDETVLAAKRNELIAMNEQVVGWFANVWFADGKPLSVEEVKKIFDGSGETDPAFPAMLVERTFSYIREHREHRKN